MGDRCVCTALLLTTAWFDAVPAPQGKMKEVLDRQVAGYVNWKATITPQVGRGLA